MERAIYPVGEDRPHTIYRLTDQIYKIIQFNDVRPLRVPGEQKEFKHYDHKLDSSISRSKRIVLELALCNPWDYFCTFTQDGSKRTRDDLIAFHKDFGQFLRDQRKKGIPVKHVIVPELHKDGSWHAHGLLSGIPDSELELFRDMDKRGYRSAEGRRLPKKLRDSDFLNWSAYQSKFGFCSLGKIRDPVASGFYITKYITKDSASMVQQVGLHTYWPARPLLRSEKHLDFYGRDPALDKLLVNKYEFCKTGMTHTKHNLDWTFGYEYLDFNALEPLERTFEPAIAEADSYLEFEQMILDSRFLGGYKF